MFPFLVLLYFFQFTLTQDVPYLANLHAHCMKCLCIAATGCDTTLQCEGGYCGPFRIAKVYWIDAGRLVHPGDTPERGDEAYEDCALEYNCASKLVTNYLISYGKDCNNDNITDCDDFALMNFNGAWSCERDLNRNEFGRRFLERYLVCNPESKLALANPPKISETIASLPASNAVEVTVNDAQALSASSFPDVVPRTCIGCICEASTGCNITRGCSSGVCGPLAITRSYWTSAGQPSFDDSNPNYITCTTDVNCSAKSLQGYMRKYRKDCNNDGVIDCDDYALLHRFGPDLCERADFTDHYGITYLDCKNTLGSRLNVNTTTDRWRSVTALYIKTVALMGSLLFFDF